MLLNAFELRQITELQNTYPETLLEDVNSWFQRLPKMAKGVNSWLHNHSYPTAPCALAEILPETTVRA